MNDDYENGRHPDDRRDPWDNYPPRPIDLDGTPPLRDQAGYSWLLLIPAGVVLVLLVAFLMMIGLWMHSFNF